MRSRQALSWILLVAGTIILATSPTQLHAQRLGDQLRDRLAGKTKLAGIMAVVDSFYLALPRDERDSGADGLIKYKHWKRWEWYLAPRLDENGDFVNLPRHYQRIIEAERGGDARRRQSPMPGEWQSIGIVESPYSNSPQDSYANGRGRVDRIAFHPTDPNIFYVGAPGGGLWRTEDAGASWTCLTDFLPTIGVSGIAVTPTAPQTLYILTGSGDMPLPYMFVNLFGYAAPCLGVYKSTNGGEAWTPTGAFPGVGSDTLLGMDLIQHTTQPDILMAATSGGIFRTTNGGTTWAKVRSGFFFDLELKPGSPAVVYAAKKDSIFYSTNSGLTWTGSSLNVPPTPAPERIALATSQADPSVVYALFGGVVYGSFSGVYRSSNSGVSFTRQGTAPNILGYELTGNDAYSQAIYDLAIAVDPGDAQRLILSGINMWTSTDGGATFTNLTKWYENQPGNANAAYIHCDHHAVAYHPVNQKLYACTDGGVYVSTNDGDTWSDITTGLVLSQFYELNQRTGTSYKLSGGLQDNGVKYRPAGVSNFTHIFGADGFSTSFEAGTSNELYATANDIGFRVNLGTGVVNNFWNNDIYFSQITAHPTNPDVVFRGGADIFRSTNQGVTWSNRGASGSWGLLFAPTNVTRMYAAGGQQAWYGPGAVYTSTNGGDSFTTISGNSGFPATFSVVTDMAVHPDTALTVFVTLGGLTAGQKVYQSTNAGQTWTNITYNLPNVTVNSVVSTGEDIFVGTDISVYHLPANGTTWTDVGDNLPHTPVTELLYDPGTGVLTAATFGRGVWERNVCVEDIHLDYPLSGSLQYSCDDMLTSTSLISGNAIDSVEFKANGMIKLLPGFKVGTGAFLKAEIDACEQGAIPLQGLPPDQTTPDAAVQSALPGGKQEQ